jgi:hypothetical protein
VLDYYFDFKKGFRLGLYKGGNKVKRVKSGVFVSVCNTLPFVTLTSHWAALPDVRLPLWPLYCHSFVVVYLSDTFDIVSSTEDD